MLQGEHSVILSTFIKLPFVCFKDFFFYFKWPFYTGFTVQDIELCDFSVSTYRVITVKMFHHL